MCRYVWMCLSIGCVCVVSVYSRFLFIHIAFFAHCKRTDLQWSVVVFLLLLSHFTYMCSVSKCTAVFVWASLQLHCKKNTESRVLMAKNGNCINTYSLYILFVCVFSCFNQPVAVNKKIATFSHSTCVHIAYMRVCEIHKWFQKTIDVDNPETNSRCTNTKNK